VNTVSGGDSKITSPIGEIDDDAVARIGGVLGL